jgi:hypothetical protein
MLEKFLLVQLYIITLKETEILVFRVGGQMFNICDKLPLLLENVLGQGSLSNLIFETKPLS